MSRDEQLKEQIKDAFDLGVRYALASQGQIETGAMPKKYDEALEYTYQYIIDKNFDKECLSCKRFESKSCMGVVDRKRKEITPGNRCSGYLHKES